jgi:hypothetical protein
LEFNFGEGATSDTEVLGGVACVVGSTVALTEVVAVPAAFDEPELDEGDETEVVEFVAVVSTNETAVV